MQFGAPSLGSRLKGKGQFWCMPNVFLGEGGLRLKRGFVESSDLREQ